jgi:hypothetical protein
VLHCDAPDHTPAHHNVATKDVQEPSIETLRSIYGRERCKTFGILMKTHSMVVGRRAAGGEDCVVRVKLISPAIEAKNCSSNLSSE